MGCVYSLLYLQLGYEGEPCWGHGDCGAEVGYGVRLESLGKASVSSGPQASPETIVMMWLSGSSP